MHRKAFTVVWLAIALIVICIIAGAAVPKYFTSRGAAREAACATNRGLLDDAKQAAMLHMWLRRSEAMEVDDLVPEYIPKLPRCRDGGSYALNGKGQPSSCSIHGNGSGDR